MIENLGERKIFSVRSETIGGIPLIRASNTKSLKERMALVVDRFQSGSSRSRTLSALRSSIDATFYPQLVEADILAVIDQMVKAKFIAVTDEKVSYKLSNDAESCRAPVSPPAPPSWLRGRSAAR